ncbi:corA-like mg2+ transporter protein domain-containing protein [Purpureocillium lavendulum]|uniref:CorA-like mg2+ transporter protein domain-containing protein n=1 Tax=Purpureocillium lavendulum TaxID=1247861 RepID=A0AB34FR70_9HYPO|nr:corA-like mg2+ transporter protein domain-containing protein [Purpureocillium lavendulum]
MFGNDVTQNVPDRYLKRESLQALLERLFYPQTEFRIRQKENQWTITVPRTVTEHAFCKAEFDSVCQRNSWRPLQITRPMMTAIVDAHDLSTSFWSLASCFYTRNVDLEEGFCVPLTVSTAGPWIELSYTLRYPEFKEAEKQWAIRQSGVCHRFNTETKQSVFMLLNPKPKSKGHTLVDKHVTSQLGTSGDDGLLSIHQILFFAYIPAWRQYIATQEGVFLPMAGSTFATYIDEPLGLGYDHLSSMMGLESSFSRTISLLASTMALLTDLKALSDDDPLVSSACDGRHDKIILGNHLRQCAAFSRTATYLQQRVQTAAQLLANTLSFRDQVIAKEQSGNMLQLNKSAVFITTLTLIYAPASFAATFFGMNFFAMDQPNSRLIGTSMIWIYLVATAVITAITIGGLSPVASQN